MYYEERWIDGKFCWRTSPNGAWTAYTANEYLLHSMVERLGHVVSTDRIHTDLAWLKEQGLISVDDVATVLVAKLQARGEDAARGRVEVPGVKRPRAG